MTRTSAECTTEPTIRVHSSLSSIQRGAWNSLLAANDAPFLRHEFINLLEQTGCATESSGWISCHLTLHQGDNNEIIAACPAYFKQHSYGEYVFDWSWARAYQQHGIDYYPKLIAAIPFTPVPARKFLSRQWHDANAINLLSQGLKNLAQANRASSVHVLFAQREEIDTLCRGEFLLRQDNQFHWHNSDYTDFDHYLSALTAKKRKNIRAERRGVAAQGITFRWMPASDTSENDWLDMYRMYRNTTEAHGGYPYLSQDFFLQLPHYLPEHVLLLQGNIAEQLICSALFLSSSDTLFGRYWGADGFFSNLHFETCYYQPIEYAIEQGYHRFEAGAQGQHKLSRGLMPTTTRSAHWLTHPEFHRAVDRYLVSEREDMAAYHDELTSAGPFRRPD